MSMIEQVARAIDDTYDVSPNGDLLNHYEVARAALLAMREPAPAMVDAFVARALQVKISGDFTWSDYAVLQWQSMLDAAIGEG